MNDDDVITTVRASFTDLQSATPLETVVGRSHVIRARRRITAAAITAAAAAIVTVGVVVASPASNRVTNPQPKNPRVALAAWTVARGTHGTIRVTFREAADASGLQRTLRADGVPVSITFTGPPNPACQDYDGQAAGVIGGSTFHPPLQKLYNHPHDAPSGHPPASPQKLYDSGNALVIHPSALPPGVGLQVATAGTPGAADNFQLSVTLVKTSPGCTGN